MNSSKQHSKAQASQKIKTGVPRKHSSDSDCSPQKPCSKRANMGSDTELASINEKLKKIMADQSNFRKSMEARLENLCKTLDAKIEAECKNVRDEIHIEFAKMSDKICAVETGLADLKSVIEMKFPVLTHVLIPPWPKSKRMILTLRSPLWSRAWGIMRERTYLGKSKPWSEMVYSCLKLKSSMQCAHHIVIISRASLKYNLKTKTLKLPFYEKSHAFFKTRDTNMFHSVFAASYQKSRSKEHHGYPTRNGYWSQIPILW